MKKSILSLFVFTIILSSVTTAQKGDYSARQEKFMSSISDGIAIIFAKGREDQLNGDYYYLTGKTNTNDILILNPQGNPKVMLFSDTEYTDLEYYYHRSDIGRMAAPLLIQNDLWASFSNIDKLKDLYYFIGSKESLRNTDLISYKLREIKDSEEQILLKKAINITAETYKHIYKFTKAGLIENQVIDEFKRYQKTLGADSTSFIQAGSGVNGTQVHADPSDKILVEGDMVVFDVGSWYKKYTSDISRSIPVGGKFSKRQREIYQLVLDAQKAAIKRMLPGVPMMEAQKIVEDHLIDGLFELGLITDKESPWQRTLYLVHPYYHYIGLDIHDVYNLMARELQTKTYEAGMIMTMEPGLYFPPDLLDRKPRRARNLSDEAFNAFVEATRENFKKYVNMGVRIEDDILITNEGNEVLSDGICKEIPEIEALMKD